ncbi:MAG: nuclear transport factor 2 family protein [Alphaproteobacteria bacterium]
MTATGTERDYEALAKEVRYLRDRLEIQDCIHRYCRGLDRLDRDIALSAYHADGSDDRGGPFVGSPREFIDWVFPDLQNAKGTSHNISNITCDITGDMAHAESYITFHVWSADDKNVIIGGARYVDRLERRDGRWAIAHREALMDYMVRLEAAPMRGGNMPTGMRNKSDRSYVRPLGLSEDAKQRLAKRKAAT